MKNRHLIFALLPLSLCIALFMFACNHNEGGGKQGGTTEKTTLKVTVKVHNKDVKEDDSIQLSSSFGTVDTNNVDVKFDKSDAPKAIFTGLPLTLQAGKNFEFTITTPETEKYEKVNKKITIKCTDVEEKKERRIKIFTIHERNAISGNVTIKEERIEKGRIQIEFFDEGAPTEFTLNPENLTLGYEESKKLTITVAESAKYRKKTIEVQVKREKNPNAPKNIDDCIEALKGKLTWVDGITDKDFTLLEAVEGFSYSNVEWKALDEKHCEISGTTVKIKKDIVDVKVELEATVKWNGEQKTVKFAVTILRHMQITDATIAQERYTFDFSTNGILLLKKNDQAVAKAKLKNVDTKEGKFLLQAEEVINGDDGKLVNLDTLIDRGISPLEKLFGEKYIGLVNANSITWSSFKDYLISVIPYKNANDERYFDKIKEDFLPQYTGTLDDFNKLDDAIRTKMIKDGLERLKKSYCKAYAFPENTPPSDILNLLKEKIRAQNKIVIDGMKAEKIISYTLKDVTQPSSYPDNIIFTAHSIHDSTKDWWEQAGTYSTESGLPKIENVGLLAKNADGKVIIEANVSKDGQSDVRFSGEIKGNVFELKGEDANNANVELKGSIVDTKDGHITFTVESGYIDAKAYSLEFEGKNILSLMMWNIR